MAEQAAQSPQKLSWRFPRTFWFANAAELCERAAYYGMFVTIWRYLLLIGFTDVQTGFIQGAFVCILYFLPTFMGILADKIGFKKALMIAFALLTAGYGLLGAFQLKWTALLSLTLIMFGGAIIKPVISGTAAKASDAANRARAMSIFYMVVNIGSFTGKSVAGSLNDRFGLRYINFVAAGLTLVALVLVSLFYRDVDREGVGKTFGEALRGLGRVVVNVRFMCLIIIVGGFWAIQLQLYSTVPTYIERLLGVGYKPEWLANVNPLVVVLLVVPITHLVRNLQPASAIGIGLLIVPFTALIISSGQFLTRVVGPQLDLGLFSLHPLIVVFIIGIGVQGLAECFLSPKWLEFASKQAPKGEVGLYLGYSHLTSAFSPLFGYILAGYLLAGYCPDPRTLPEQTRHQWRAAIDPHYRFNLDPALADDLREGLPPPAPLREALAGHGVNVPELETLRPGQAGSQWKEQSLAAWELPAEDGVYTLVKTRYRVDTGTSRMSPTQRIRSFFVSSPADQRFELLVLADQPRPPEQMPPLPAEFSRAHYIWYVFTAVGFAALGALLAFKVITEAVDRSRAARGGAAQ